MVSTVSRNFNNVISQIAAHLHRYRRCCLTLLVSTFGGDCGRFRWPSWRPEKWTAKVGQGDTQVVTELGKLIEAAARANHGRSMQAAADLATKRGHPISKSHISQNAREIKSITPQLIRGIAAGYDLPEEEVARAVLADLGFTIDDYNPTPESAIRRDPQLSAEARGILLAALEAARFPTRTPAPGDDPQQRRRGLLGRRSARQNPGVSGDEHGDVGDQFGGA